MKKDTLPSLDVKDLDQVTGGLRWLVKTGGPYEIWKPLPRHGGLR